MVTKYGILHALVNVVVVEILEELKLVEADYLGFELGLGLGLGLELVVAELFLEPAVALVLQ